MDRLRGKICGETCSLEPKRPMGTATVEYAPIIVFLPKKDIQNLCFMCQSLGLCSPLGVLGTAVAASGGHLNCARDWRGAERSRRIAAGRNPRKARFFAKQKMRPNTDSPVLSIYATGTSPQS
jgi:hypothetical protein